MLAAPVATLFKDPSCGCCSKWGEHMASKQLPLTIAPRSDMSAIKDQLQVPAKLRSCHTATIGKYVFEGHVPADLVQKVLKEKPDIRGLAVAGMPQGSPGMETGAKQPYQVMAFDAKGKQWVYANR
ncbi:DUF411 domain-containing protein [Vogesella fluminis]|uniref:DUF411 domain-containing protein n=1 Tax=Vogesella fluminis TaxID=1069161 RepID=UPI00364345CA